MKNRLAAMQQKLAAAIQSLRAITDKAADENRDLTDDETKQATALRAEIDRHTAAVTEERRLIEAERELTPARTLIDPNAPARVDVGLSEEDKRAADPKRGFKSFGDFVRCVMAAGKRGSAHRVDERLQIEAAAPTTYGNETTGADGGYLVPPEYARTIYQHSLDEGSFLPLTDQLPIGGNSITFPADETTPWGTNGIRMYWSNEAGAATQTKPVLDGRTLKLRKLIGLVPLTDELIADANTAGMYVQRKLGTSLAWKVNDTIVNGIGGQLPLGFRNGGGIISQAAESAQVAATIVAANCAKMLGRLAPASLASQGLRWLINNDALNQLVTMTLGNQLVWTPPQTGFQNAPMGFLFGRPIVITQVCQTLGTVGDIMLADFRQYVTISKGPEYAESMHIFFDTDAMAFRLVFRMDGMPWSKAAISPANGSNTLGHYVQLATRS